MTESEPATGSVTLIVDDDVVFRERLLLAFQERGLAVAGAGTVEEALGVAGRLRPARAVVDLKMPGESGLELVRHLLDLQPEIAVIVLTGYGSIATAKEAIQLGARDYLTKPADVDQILSALDGSRATGKEPPPGPGTAPSLARVEWEHIQRVLADCNGNVSQAARALGIHRRSLQRKLARFPPPES